LEKPTVGLLSVGEEEEKGNEAVFEANKLLADSPLNYVGHVEGGDILKGKVDVVACDGFTGNALLKFAEAVPGIVFSGLRSEVKRDFATRVGAWLAKAGLRRLRKRWDYAEYGGAPLLGVRNGVIICHGKSSARAIKNAVLVAEKFVRAGGPAQIAEMAGRFADER
jgi:glycerol-3-phosphate acyltransferase PlsX